MRNKQRLERIEARERTITSATFKMMATEELEEIVRSTDDEWQTLPAYLHFLKLRREVAKSHENGKQS